MKKILLIGALMAFTSGLCFAQDNVAYKASLTKMMEVSGSKAVYDSAIQQMISMMKDGKSNVPEAFWDGLNAELSKQSVSSLTDLLLPIYQKYLSLEDIKQLILFYQTPVGKKFAEKSPMIMQESMKAGGEWGAKIGQEIAEKLKEKGY